VEHYRRVVRRTVEKVDTNLNRGGYVIQSAVRSPRLLNRNNAGHFKKRRLSIPLVIGENSNCLLSVEMFSRFYARVQRQRLRRRPKTEIIHHRSAVVFTRWKTGLINSDADPLSVRREIIVFELRRVYIYIYRQRRLTGLRRFKSR